MTAQIIDLALAAGRSVIDPFVLAAVAVATMGVVTGMAGRALELVEEFRLRGGRGSKS